MTENRCNKAINKFNKYEVDESIKFIFLSGCVDSIPDESQDRRFFVYDFSKETK